MVSYAGKLIVDKEVSLVALKHEVLESESVCSQELFYDGFGDFRTITVGTC